MAAVDPTAPPPALDISEVTERVLGVLRKFEKVKDPAAVTATSHFATDLGQQKRTTTTTAATAPGWMASYALHQGARALRLRH
jgi:hypothetical protein